MGDGGNGYPELATYDKICITAACRQVPPPLVEQLRTGGRIIGPVERAGLQELVLLEKTNKGVKTRTLCEVLYISLRGKYGGI
jgi:protein-L-isoaspartate(D-aspartate) O-methyltransferase